jgi:hypothetical protein
MAALALGCGPRATPARELQELALVEELPAARLHPVVCAWGGDRRVSSVEPKKQRGHVVVVVDVEAPAAVGGVTRDEGPGIIVEANGGGDCGGMDPKNPPGLILAFQ